MHLAPVDNPLWITSTGSSAAGRAAGCSPACRRGDKRDDRPVAAQGPAAGGGVSDARPGRRGIPFRSSCPLGPAPADRSRCVRHARRTARDTPVAGPRAPAHGTDSAPFPGQPGRQPRLGAGGCRRTGGRRHLGLTILPYSTKVRARRRSLLGSRVCRANAQRLPEAT